jgi:hypothetical protein
VVFLSELLKLAPPSLVTYGCHLSLALCLPVDLFSSFHSKGHLDISPQWYDSKTAPFLHMSLHPRSALRLSLTTHLPCESSWPSTPSPKSPTKDYESFFSTSFDVTKRKLLTPAYIGQKVCGIVNCFRCQKPRCVYATKPLTSNHRQLLQEVQNTTVFACGTAFLLPGHPLEGRVYTKTLTCSASVQRAFYTSSFAVFDVCSHCGGKDGEILKSERRRRCGPELPFCKECSNYEVKWIAS